MDHFDQIRADGIETYLDEHQNKELLRFITGAVRAPIGGLHLVEGLDVAVAGWQVGAARA